MAVEVTMPQLGESVHEGTIGKWLKQEGDAVERYEPLLEVVTDKVDTEVTAAESGTLLQILVPEGETVQVGTVLALLGTADEAGAAGPTAASASRPAAEAASVAAAAGETPAEQAPVRVSRVAARVAAEHGVDPGRVSGSGRSGQVTRADVERFVTDGGAVARPGAEPVAAPATRDPGFISPRVARLAVQHGVDLGRVTGSGKDGRITARDVEAFVAGRADAPAAAAPTAPATAAATPPRPAAPPAGVAAGQLVELSNMRRSIAEHMVRSKHASPHVTTVHEVDMSAVTAAYRARKGPFAERGVKLTYTAFIVEAVAAALAEHPMVNSSWTDQGVQLHRDVNIGVAVALPTGLIVPVIRHANEKSLEGLARELTDLANRARARQLVPDDVQGGTFTITNYGTLGSLIGTPVINQPQAAILGTGAIRKQVVVLEGPDGDSIGIRPLMFLSLTFDHRILDGGTADPFVRTIVRRLEGVGG